MKVVSLAICKLTGTSPYSQSKAITSVKPSQEPHDDFDRRVWKEHCHVDEATGRIFISAYAIKNCLSDSASFLSLKVPGKRSATFTKHFLAGLIVPQGVMLDTHIDKVECERLSCSADGKKNGSTRVWRTFPVIRKWEGEVPIVVLDETITQEVLQQHGEAAGMFIGLGRSRPRNGGSYGRFTFEIKSFKKMSSQDLARYLGGQAKAS